MTDLTQKLKEKLAPWPESTYVDVYEMGRADENARLAPLHSALIECVAALEKYANPDTHSMDKSGFVWSGDYFDYETASEALDKLREVLGATYE